MRRIPFIASLVFAVWLVMAPAMPAAFADESLVVRFLDVGAGDATLITAPNGRQILVDCGPATSSKSLVLQLQAAGVDHLDLLAPSSKRPEAIGGCTEILRRFTVSRLATTSQKGEVANTWRTFSSFADALAADQLLQSGSILDTTFVLGQGATATVLNPRPDGELFDDYDGSQVLLIDYAGTRILLMGAVHRGGEVKLAAQDPVTILKIGDHASADTADPRFLSWAAPSYAIVSYANGRGFPQPDPDTLARIGQYTRPENIFGTAQSGTITVVVGADGSRSIYGER